jgi:hypothetical protein
VKVINVESIERSALSTSDRQIMDDDGPTFENSGYESGYSLPSYFPPEIQNLADVDEGVWNASVLHQVASPWQPTLA